MKDRFRFAEGISRKPGMCVMKVIDRKTGEMAIAKAVSGNAPAALQTQLDREARLLKNIRTDAVPAYLDFEEETGRRILFEQFIEGETLRQWNSRFHWPGTKKKLFLQIVSLIEKVHETGFVYLDLHPGNILVRDGKAFLIDFNSVVPIGSRKVILSNAAACPPERNSRPLRETSDLPGLGAIHAFLFGRSSIYWLCRQEDPEARFASLADLKRTVSPGFRKLVLAAAAALLAAGCFWSWESRIFLKSSEAVQQPALQKPEPARRADWQKEARDFLHGENLSARQAACFLAEKPPPASEKDSPELILLQIIRDHRDPESAENRRMAEEFLEFALGQEDPILLLSLLARQKDVLGCRLEAEQMDLIQDLLWESKPGDAGEAKDILRLLLDQAVRLQNRISLPLWMIEQLEADRQNSALVALYMKMPAGKTEKNNETDSQRKEEEDKP